MKKEKKKINRSYLHQKCPIVLFLSTLFLLVTLRLGLFHIENTYKDKVDLITNFPISSQVYDRNGELLYEYFGDIRRIPVPAVELPQSLIDATLMAEDERFYNHPGFDPLGIARAFWRNMLASEIVEGGSTLGQQLVKNTILGPSDGYEDKIEEILLSVAVDAKYSKDAILQLYLNTIPYGSNVYGAETASRLYFGKHVKDLSVSESAILASLPKHPTYLSPYGEHVNELEERRDWVLEKMYSHKLISELDYSTALSTPLAFSHLDLDIKAPHFVMHLREELIEVLGEERVEQGGLVVRTTLDLSLQEKAELAVSSGATLREKYRADSTGLLAMNPQNGEVLAMVGNIDYFNLEEAGNVNTTTALRQPGSAFKPLVYSALLDKEQYTPASVLYDEKKDFSLGDEPYIPQNYDLKYRGPVRMRDALAQSLNVPAVQALMAVSIDSALDFAEDLGISSLDDRKRFGPSLVLGGAEVTLVDLVNAYATFANEGAYLPAQTVLEIHTIEGEMIDWRTALPRQVMHAETAYQMSSMLSDNKARTPVFGSKSSLSFTESGHQVAAKTGTTQAYRDAWTVGYTPEIAVGVWVGNHQNEPMRYGAAGALAAAPVWRSFMDSFLEDRAVIAFEQPDYLELQKVYTVLGPKEELVAPWQIDAKQQVLAQRRYLWRSHKRDIPDSANKS
jgi:penicillin-binding protein 1C